MKPRVGVLLAVCCALATAGCGSRGSGEGTAPAPATHERETDSEEAMAAGTDVLLVANKGEASVSFVDPQRRTVVATVAVGAGPHEVAASRDGELAVVTNYGTRDEPGSTLTVLDVNAREAVRTIDLGEHTRPHGVVWLPGRDEVLVTAEATKHLLCVDPRSGEIGCAIPTGQEVSHMVAVTPDGRRAFVANIGSGSVTAIDVEAGEKLADIETGEGAEGVAVSPNGREVWVTNRGADTVTVIDTQTLDIVDELSSSSFPIRAVFTADGSAVLVTNARSGTVSVFDGERRELRATVDMGVEPPDPDDERILGHFEDTTLPIGVVADPASARAYIAHALADVVSILDLETLETAGTIDVGTEPDGMAYLPGR